MKKKWLAFPVALVLITGLMVAGCNTGDGNTGDGTGGGTVTKADLQAVIDAATAAKQNVATDTDGEITPSWQQWVTEEAFEALVDAIEAATAVSLLNPTQEQLKTAIAALTAALNTFNSAKQQGKKTSGFNQNDMDTLVGIAEAAMEGIKESTVNGIDVSRTEEWVTPAQMNALTAVIATAKGLLNDTNYLALVAALDTFNKAKKPGTKDPTDTSIHYTVIQNYGVIHKTDTESLTLKFTESIPRDGLAPADITISDDTGSAKIDPDMEEDGMTNSPGETRMLYITVARQGIIKIKITKAGFSAGEREVTVYKKAGLEPDDDVTIADIVLVGTPVLPDGSPITFARNDGDPIAILPPRTRDPITSIGTTSTTWGFEHVIATFDPPVDLTTIAGQRDFRWIDMVWDGFGDQYDFDTESTVTQSGNTYTGTRYDLHNVTFQLDLTTDTDQRIRFQKQSETDTTTRAKKPVQFLKSNIQTGTGNTAWDASTQKIKAITLRITGMQLRSPTNTVWPSIGTTRNPVMLDTWILSLSVDARVPPPVKVLYNADGWITDIKNPKTATGDPKADDPDVSDASSESPIVLSVEAGSQKLVYWDPLDITTTGTFAPYSQIIITTTPTSGGVSWYGYGSMSLNTGNNVYDEADRNKNMAWDGTGASGVLSIPLSPTGGKFNEKKFIGFFIQADGSLRDITITQIRLE